MCYNNAVKGDEFQNKMKKIIDKNLAKTIIINLAKLRKQQKNGVIRVIQNKEGNTFFISHEPGKFKVFEAITLKECGSTLYEIKEEGGLKFSNLICVKVDSDHQKSGIGTQLMKFIESEMKKLGVDQISLIANARALGGWYENLGYKQITNYTHIKDTFIKTHLKRYKKINYLSDIVDKDTQEELLTPRFSFLPGRKKKAKALERTLDENCG